jgi:hypothetical protein
MGDMPGRALLRFRTIYLTLHAWDLARASGSSVVLDPELVAHAWREIEPTASRMGAMGFFGDGPKVERFPKVLHCSSDFLTRRVVDPDRPPSPSRCAQNAGPRAGRTAPWG